MKRLLKNYLSMTLIASLFVMAGCGGDEEVPLIDAPVINFGAGAGEDDELTVDVGEPVAFDINITAPGGVNRVEVTQEGSTTALIDTARASGDVPTTFTVPFSFTPSAEDAGETLTFNIRVTGEDEQDARRTYTIIVNEAQVMAYNTVLLAAPLAPTAPETNSPSETFFSTTTGETYSVDEVNSTEDPVSSWIDFGYFYGNNVKATIASPAAYPFPDLAGFNAWSDKNNTKIKPTNLEISQSEFTEYNNADEFQTIFEDSEYSTLEGSATATTREGRVTNLQAGDVLVFMTDSEKEGGAKYGLVYVNEVVGTTGKDDRISISVRVAP